MPGTARISITVGSFSCEAAMTFAPGGGLYGLDRERPSAGSSFVGVQRELGAPGLPSPDGDHRDLRPREALGACTAGSGVENRALR